MRFEIELAGRVRQVSVEPVAAGDRGGRFRVVVRDPGANRDARAYEVDARPTDLGVSLLYASDGRSVDVAVTARPGGERFLQLPHVAVTAVIDGQRSPARPGRRNAAHAGGLRLMAPMPGRVVRVLVAVGDRVTAGQGLVVIEAMKMENELVAAGPGIVTTVAVSEGVSVEAGLLLVALD